MKELKMLIPVLLVIILHVGHLSATLKKDKNGKPIQSVHAIRVPCWDQWDMKHIECTLIYKHANFVNKYVSLSTEQRKWNISEATEGGYHIGGCFKHGCLYWFAEKRGPKRYMHLSKEPITRFSFTSISAPTTDLNVYKIAVHGFDENNKHVGTANDKWRDWKVTFGKPGPWVFEPNLPRGYFTEKDHRVVTTIRRPCANKHGKPTECSEPDRYAVIDSDREYLKLGKTGEKWNITLASGGGVHIGTCRGDGCFYWFAEKDDDWNYLTLTKEPVSRFVFRHADSHEGMEIYEIKLQDYSGKFKYVTHRKKYGSEWLVTNKGGRWALETKLPREFYRCKIRWRCE